MVKLIRLEWKKNRIGRYILAAAAVAVLLCLFIFALTFWGIASEPDGTLDAAPGAGRISASIELFTSMSFLVFAGVMLASFIVSSYKNKTMNLMFSYPIRRQKILASQMAAVWIFNFTALILTKAAVYACVSIGAGFLQSPFAIDFDMGSLSFYIPLILKSFSVVSMSFIALFAGMAMKSSKATIITSFLLIFLTQANVGDLTMADQPVFPIVLTVISFLFAGMSLYNVEKRDLK
ncbi:ABC transporter permease [Qiania dongpingensis]|uniref:ABC transporter permease n=1 Tax=Qiania dongpingensis TaxID=2763669 RepID=A0A7G9G3K8_9FIRM|nr:ABC transporter permease [Qiania dongpingensis]QNM05390.1 ABC transporter permease [Qiania dongpingensis]